MSEVSSSFVLTRKTDIFRPYFYCPCCLLKVKACCPLKDETTDVFCLSSYGLQIDTIRLDFKSGLETLLKDKPIRAIFLGVRMGDPTAVSLVFNLGIPFFCLF